MKPDPAKVRSTLLGSLEEAGQILKETVSERRVVAHKEELSLVTETDRKSEEVIVKNILRNFPDHAILTEESHPPEFPGPRHPHRGIARARKVALSLDR